MSAMTSAPHPPADDIRFYESADGSLAYRDLGEGPAVVLLHGGFLDGRMWDDVAAALADEFRVVMPDARGHGQSVNSTAPFRPTDDLADLLGHLGIDSAVLVGVSMGAGTAVDTALEHPELVRALVVSGAGTSEPVFEAPWTLGVLAEWAQSLGSGDVEGWVAAFSQFTVGPHRTPAEVDPAVVRRVEEMARHTVAKHTPDEVDQRVPVADTWARAAGISVPVLGVIGAVDADDHIAMVQRLVASVADGRSVVVEGTAHYPNMEKPAEFAALVRDFAREAFGTTQSER